MPFLSQDNGTVCHAMGVYAYICVYCCGLQNEINLLFLFGLVDHCVNL